LVPCQPSGRRVIPSGRPSVQSIIRPDGENFPSGPSSVSRSFELLQLALVRTFQQHVRTTLSVRPSCRIFFPKHRYGKIDVTVQTTWILLQMHSSLREVSQFKSRRPDDGPHGPDARASDMEIACIKSTVRTTIPLVWMSEAFIRKLLAVEVQLSGRQGTIVWTQLKNRKDFQRNSQEVDRTVVCPDSL